MGEFLHVVMFITFFTLCKSTLFYFAFHFLYDAFRSTVTHSKGKVDEELKKSHDGSTGGCSTSCNYNNCNAAYKVTYK